MHMTGRCTKPYPKIALLVPRSWEPAAGTTVASNNVFVTYLYLGLGVFYDVRAPCLCSVVFVFAPVYPMHSKLNHHLEARVSFTEKKNWVDQGSTYARMRPMPDGCHVDPDAITWHL